MYSLPIELWLEIAEHGGLEAQIALALCSRQLWFSINRHLHPLSTEKWLRGIDVNLEQRPFCWLKTDILLTTLQEHVSCPICQKLHPFQKFKNRTTCDALRRYARNRHCSKWDLWTRSLNFVVAKEFAAGYYFPWIEGRFIMEQSRLGNYAPLRRLNKRPISGMWQMFSDFHRYAPSFPSVCLHWWSRAAFQIKHDHLCVYEENYTIVSRLSRDRQASGLAINISYFPVKLRFSLDPCQHGHDAGVNHLQLLTNLHNQAQQACDGKARKDLKCLGCTTRYSFIVEQIKACPQRKAQKCQQVVVLRMIDLGGFRTPNDDIWMDLCQPAQLKFDHRVASLPSMRELQHYISEIQEYNLIKRWRTVDLRKKFACALPPSSKCRCQPYDVARQESRQHLESSIYLWWWWPARIWLTDFLMAQIHW